MPYENQTDENVTPFARPKRRNKRRASKPGNTRLFSGIAVTVVATAAILAALRTGELTPFPETTTFESISLPICRPGKRVSCVVDGDTIWLRGEKIRLAGIDAPEVSKPRCRREASLGRKATRRLRKVLSSRKWAVVREGHDRYGRTLARLHLKKGTAGQLLVKEGLAKTWRGRKARWC